MIKAIFFDLDGTLYSHKYKRVPQSTITALDILKKKGILRILATGRSMLELEQIQLEYMDFDAFILLNGQVVLNHEHQIIMENPIEDPDLTTLIKLYDQKKYPLQLLDAFDSYINIVNEKVIKAQGDINTPAPPVKEFQNKPILQAVAFVDNQEADIIEEKLPNCSITRWNNVAIDILSKKSGKANTIERYIQRIGIKQEETMSFGDGINDISMIEYCHIGIAMGNAKEEVKAIADYITTDIDQTGLYKALKHFECI